MILRFVNIHFADFHLDKLAFPVGCVKRFVPFLKLPDSEALGGDEGYAMDEVLLLFAFTGMMS